jgi:type IV pilus assembly protein PilB
MTGHLVLSTLHTNSAVDSIPRMLDMKIEPYLLSTTLNVVMAQRLVRKICEECKYEDDLDQGLKKQVITEVSQVSVDVLKGYGDLNLEKPTFYRGKGCARCGNTGFKGRTAITEVVENTRGLKNAINSGMKQDDVLDELSKQQFVSMKRDGLIKVLLGITTPEQIFAVTKEDI